MFFVTHPSFAFAIALQMLRQPYVDVAQWTNDDLHHRKIRQNGKKSVLFKTLKKQLGILVKQHRM